MKKYLNWAVGHSNLENVPPQKKIEAKVPGAVQLDFSKHEGWEHYSWADNYKDYAWMEDQFWSYITYLEPPTMQKEEQLFFVCKGVDYRFKVKLNGEVIHDQEGMFTPFEINLTDKAKKGDKLEILVFPAPKLHGKSDDRSQASQSCKPAVSYGWDWHPRLIPLGIWDETYLEIRPTFFIQNAELQYDLAQDFLEAQVKLEVELSGIGEGYLKWSLLDPQGLKVIDEKIFISLNKIHLNYLLNDPQLWWPNGHGKPNLYGCLVELYDNDGILLDQKSFRVGFRKVNLVMHPGAWATPQGFPKTRSNPPTTLEINGREIFSKGSNWVNPEIFPGVITEETYRPLLQMAKDAHMNLLRCWGGAIVNKEIFFDLCDELGLMVWQEFPLACNNYEATKEYLSVLDQESKSIILRLRRHPCLAIWCGGNELFNAWSKMTDQSLALRLLNRNCYDLNPEIPFIMTSPLMGMAHGCYLFQYLDGKDVFEVMPNASFTAYTEFGCPAPSSVECLKKFIPENELFPPKAGTTWETHHGFNAWGARKSTWLQPEIIEEYFGQSQTLEELVEKGNILQCEGYKCIFEEARRQKPMCAMALNWCYNDAWPTAANNSIIEWPNKPKPAYFAVQASCRPVIASARISKYQWKEGEWFEPELWILNDSYNCFEGSRVEAFLKIEDEEFFLLAWDFLNVEVNTNLPGPKAKFKLPRKQANFMVLELRVKNHPEWNSKYTLSYQPKIVKQTKETPILNMQ